MIKEAKVLVGTAALAAMLVAGPAAAERRAGDIIGRIGLTNVDPKQDNGNLDLRQLDLAQYQVDVDDDTQVGVTGVYMFTDNIGLELLASLPFEHDISVNGVQVGSTQHLPPTLSVQWHFNPAGDIHPYVGLGLNYTIFFSQEANGADAGSVLGNPALNGATIDDFSLDNSFGYALQAGVDFELNERMLLNFDVRYADIDADIDDLTVGGVGKVSNVGTAEIDPIIISLMLGYKF